MMLQNLSSAAVVIGPLMVKQEGQGTEWEYLFGYSKISHIYRYG